MHQKINIKSKKNEYDKMLVIPTFLNSDILVNSGNIKNSTYNPLKEYILLIPSTKVSFIPYPKRGNTLWKVYSPKEPKNINTIPISLYVLARQITLGDYIQSIDAIFLLIWIPFMLAYLSTNIHFALTTFKQLTPSPPPLEPELLAEGIEIWNVNFNLSSFPTSNPMAIT